MTGAPDQISAYVPAIVREVVQDSGQPQGADEHTLHGTVLLADISGFSRIAEQLAAQGSAGAEQLAGVVNAFFGRLTDIVEIHGGDVIRLAGDAVLALWTAADGIAAVATWRAAHCALAIQESLAAKGPSAFSEISVRIGIGAGAAGMLRAGGLNGCFQAALCGAAVDGASRAQLDAEPGTVALASAAWGAIAQSAIGAPLGEGSFRLQRLRELPGAVPPERAPAMHLTGDARTMLRAYVPRSVLGRLDTGQDQWQAELRRISVLFINLLEIESGGPEFLDTIQTAVLCIQHVADRYEGTLTELVFDDKGTTAIVVLGLPPLAHEDDASRAIDTALELRTKLAEQNIRSGIGITTGTVFAGSIGNDRRREYKIIGDVVNLAARLMKARPGEAVCDPATYRAAQSRFAFEPLPAIAVKGRSARTQVFRPLRRTATGTATRTAPIIGREAERAQLRERLGHLVEGRGCVVFIEGEPGVGKSRLVADLVDEARAKGLRCLVGAGDSIEQRTPYQTWRVPLARLLEIDIDSRADPAGRREKVLAWLRVAGLETNHAALLNAVLPLDFPDSEITAQMSGPARSDTTHDLVIEMLRRIALDQAQRVLLVLEDAHWFDSASWILARLVAQRLPAVLLVITTRSMAEPVPPLCARLKETPGALCMSLEGLLAEDIDALLCHRLGAARLSRQVSDLIQRRAQGNPFFSEELGYALRDAGAVEVRDGVCDVTPAAGPLESLELPQTVQGVVTARVDRLSPQQQLTLKVASVIGRIFAYRLLRDIYPISEERPELEAALALLSRINITQIETPEPDLAYLFRHAITHEVAYGLMTFAQRRQLHRSVADWYERTRSDDLSAVYALLAFHWRRAEDRAKSIDYLEKAGEQALRNSAFKEAIAFFDDAFVVAAQKGETVPDLRLARWERQLGEAHLGLGHLPESRAHLERVLTLLGWTIPAGPVSWLTQAGGEFARQLAHRLWPSRFIGSAGSNVDAYIEASRARGRLAELYFYGHEKLPMLHAVVSTLNLAEAVGPSPELARAYGSFSYAIGSVPLHGLAEAYGSMARDTAAAAGDLPAQLWALEVTGFYDIGVANWSRARQSLEHAMSIAERLGDRRRRDECLGLLLVATHYQGEFSRALEMSRDVYASSRRREDAQFQIVGLIGQSENLLVLGRIRETLDLLREALALLAEAPDFTQEMKVYELHAIVRLRLGETGEALAQARKGVEFIKRRLPMATHGLSAYVGPAEVYLQLWEAGDAGHRRAARRACAALDGFAGVFPIGKPRALLMRGRLHWLDGARSRAIKAWKASLDEARRLGMPYDEGLSHMQLGQRLAGKDPEAQAHLDAAAKIFTRIGAARDLELARALRGAAPPSD